MVLRSIAGAIQAADSARVARFATVLGTAGEDDSIVAAFGLRVRTLRR